MYFDKYMWWWWCACMYGVKSGVLGRTSCVTFKNKVLYWWCVCEVYLLEEREKNFGKYI